MKKFNPGLLPTLITVPCVIILLALTVWQINRYSWKVNLIGTINSQLAEAPVPLPSGDIAPEDWQYRRVKLTGSFDHSKEIHLFAHADPGRPGFQIITPFLRPAGGDVVLVNRGWVPEDKKDPFTRPEGQIAGEITITGVVRKPWGKAWSFMPESNAESNVWLYGEIVEMADHLKMKVAPVFVELDASDVPGGLPIGGQTRISLPNNHIQYAFTWFGLAIAMGVIFILYGLKRGRPGKE
ncbi:MAG: SURF1 family protein [Sneathiella sp.]|nr:SURF1 family protein [Sneathiella sp.]